MRTMSTIHAIACVMVVACALGAEKNTSSSSDVDNVLSDYGPGAYGSVDMSYGNGQVSGIVGGHVVFWKNNNSGETKYYDGQCNKKYDTYEDLLKNVGANPDYKATTYRLDQTELNYAHMDEDSVFRSKRGSSTRLLERRSTGERFYEKQYEGNNYIQRRS